MSHAVLDTIHRRLQGLPDNERLAVLAPGGGQRWVLPGGMGMRLRAHGLEADLVGGTSGGGLAMLFYADGGSTDRAMVLHSLTAQGFDQVGGTRFIDLRRILTGAPVMDTMGLIHDVFTQRYPILWDNLAAKKHPIFLTATMRNGESKVLRLDGTNANFCKAAALHTCRLPWIAHNPSDLETELWDGALSNDLPIDDALALGATQVLVLMTSGADEVGVKEESVVERLLIHRQIKTRCPQLHKLWATRSENHVATYARYRNDPRVLFIQPPKVLVNNASTQARALLQGVKQGWDYLGEALQLPPLPYPTGWLVPLATHGLLATSVYSTTIKHIAA